MTTSHECKRIPPFYSERRNSFAYAKIIRTLTTSISAFNNNLRYNNNTEWRTFATVDILSIFTLSCYTKARSPQPSPSTHQQCNLLMKSLDRKKKFEQSLFSMLINCMSIYWQCIAFACLKDSISNNIQNTYLVASLLEKKLTIESPMHLGIYTREDIRRFLSMKFWFALYKASMFLITGQPRWSSMLEHQQALHSWQQPSHHHRPRTLRIP